MSQPSPQGAPAASAGAIDYNIQVSKVDTNVLRRITVMAFKYRGRMALAIIATIIAANLQLLMPQYIGQAVDQAQGLLGGAVSGVTSRAEAEAARRPSTSAAVYRIRSPLSSRGSLASKPPAPAPPEPAASSEGDEYSADEEEELYSEDED